MEARLGGSVTESANMRALLADDDAPGGVTESVNMWALLDDNEPGDSQEAKRYMRTVAAAPDAEVITVRNGKRMEKKRSKAPEPAAVANGGEVAVADQRRNDRKTKATTAVSNCSVPNGLTKGCNEQPEEVMRGGICAHDLFVAALLAVSLYVYVSMAPAV